MFFWNSLSQNAICAVSVVISPCYAYQAKVNRTAMNTDMLVLLGDIYATDQDKRQKAIEAYK